MEIADFLIVGSGCTGAIAAHELCLTGKRVVMVDVGIQSLDTPPPEEDFMTIRNTFDDQKDLFLGSKFEALQTPQHKNIPQQTAQRKYMTELIDKLIPISSDTIFPVESLALGGLGTAGD
jgi:choline dehydrogenase-like flavoprotein